MSFGKDHIHIFLVFFSVVSLKWQPSTLSLWIEGRIFKPISLAELHVVFVPSFCLECFQTFGRIAAVLSTSLPPVGFLDTQQDTIVATRPRKSCGTANPRQAKMYTLNVWF